MLKIVILFCVLFYVNASVVVNIFDDDTSISSQSLESCNLVWCEQQCRRMGFPGGVCVGDRCKCDIMGTRDTSISSQSLESCNLVWCEQQCRRMGFPGGVCVGDRCKCDIMGTKDAAISSQSIESCNLVWCKQQCRRMGFPGGVCVGDRCKCDIMSNEIDQENKTELSCVALDCDQKCRHFGLHGGDCVDGRCKCDIKNIKHNIAKETEKLYQYVTKRVIANINDELEKQEQEIMDNEKNNAANEYKIIN